MKTYSPYFKTLYDEQAPVGKIGDGVHYSILEFFQWKDIEQKPLDQAYKQRLAIIWDIDHDERIIPLIEKAYFEGNLSTVCVVGERKGSLTLLLKPEFCMLSNTKVKQGIEALKTLGNYVDQDYWHTEVEIVFNTTDVHIIQDSKENTRAYLGFINMLWNIF